MFIDLFNLPQISSWNQTSVDQ